MKAIASMKTYDYPVIIIGGGPVGFGLAIDLAQRGVKVLVVEKYASPQPVPKGQNLTQRTMEHFQAWHAEQALRDARTVPAEYGIGGITVYETLLGEYHYDWLQRGLVRAYYAAANERLPQYATEAVLRRRAAELDNIEVLVGWEVDGVTQDTDSVTVRAFERRTGERRTVTGRYAVGADGGRSVTRESTGITRTTFDHDRLMVLLVFRSERLHQLLERYPGKSFYNVLHPDLQGYWLFFGRVDLAGTFFFHAPVPKGVDPDHFDFHAYVNRAVGEAIDLTVEHRGFWECRVAIADGYRAGRVFLAGDAAHNHPPYGGYGINTGFEDARNLGWKLAAVLDGRAGNALLDSYDAERRPVFWSTARDFIEKSIDTDRDFLAAYSPHRDRDAFEAEWAARSSGAASEVGRFQPNYRGSRIVWGDDDGAADAVAPHRFKARAGFHLAPLDIGDDVNVYDRIGADFTLISVGDNSDMVAAFEDAAAVLGVELRVVNAVASSQAGEYETPLVLVRPDHFVAWTDAGEGPDPLVVLRRTLGLSGVAG